MTLWEIVTLLIVGLAAGTAGGLLGIGGSIIMIPAMAFLFHDRAWDNQHLYQAAAMVVNLAVALPAADQHRRAKAIPASFVRVFLPATMVAIVAGVFVSNLLPSDALRMIFAVFLLYVAVTTTIKAVKRTEDHETAAARVTAPRSALVGGVTGLAGGVLGIGGGVVSVPLAHALCRLPLRQCIAAGAVAMVFSAPVGAGLKLATLDQVGGAWTTALIMAAALAPTAVLGGFLGAGLTHKAPLGALRSLLAGLLLIMSGRMFGLY